MSRPNVTSEYALRAMVFMARDPRRWVRAEEIAASTTVPRPYLARVLHTLARKGLVTTKRGYRGGYRLSRSPAEIGIYEIAALFGGEPLSDRCLLGFGPCSNERGCPLHGPWSKARTRLRRLYRDLTLASVASVVDARVMESN